MSHPFSSSFSFNFTADQSVATFPPALPTAMSFNFSGTPESIENESGSDDACVDDIEVDNAYSDSDASADSDDEMELDLEDVHDKLHALELSDTVMADSDSDSDFGSDSESSESGDGDGDSDADDDGADVPEPTAAELLSEAAADGACIVPPNPHVPPPITSPDYDAWVAARTPNIIFSVRIRPLVDGTMIAAHSTLLWYRDFATRRRFLEHIVEEYALLNVYDICGFAVKERRSGVWVELGTDDASWASVLARIRNKIADENLTGSANAVSADLRVLVGGVDDFKGAVVEMGKFVRVKLQPEDDPDL